MAARSPSDEALVGSEPHEPSTTGRTVYKKSGEAVASILRKLVRSQSSPPKSVDFDTRVDVRTFMCLDRPAAISAEPCLDRGRRVSPPPLLLNILTPLHPRSGPLIRLERLGLSADGASLQGSVAVANLAYEKRVHCRFTVDDWQTVGEVAAAYASAILDTDDDRFVFAIALSDMVDLEHKSLILCLRYRVRDLEFWDNNNGSNFRVEFRRAPEPATISFSAPSTPRPAPCEDAVDTPLALRGRDLRTSQLGRFAEVGRSRQSRTTTMMPLPIPRSGGGFLGRYSLDAQLNASRMAAIA